MEVEEQEQEQGQQAAYRPFETAASRKRRLAAQQGGVAKAARGIVVTSGAAKAEAHGAGHLAKAAPPEEKTGQSLVELARDLREANPSFERDKREAEERKFLETVTAQQSALVSTAEKASGHKAFTESLRTGWRPASRVRRRDEAAHQRLRDELHVLVYGEDVPPPCRTFKEMRLPVAIIRALRAKGIKRPTPIQLQGLPVALSGRDMIGIAFTGSGKTLTFSLPMVLQALGEEMRLPLRGGEGPFGVVLGPSRELMAQTFDLVEYLCDSLARGGFPRLRATLAIGGTDRRQQVALFEREGVHLIVATPGRLGDFLQRRQLSLAMCRYFCLDEGDRMVADDSFGEELQRILGYCKVQRQTLLFSATMPRNVVDFAQSTLIRPVTVNVGRAGAANLDISQEVEFVAPAGKIVYLLECLQKAPPPAVIFADSKKECDDIHEYLLLKGVEAVAVHGGKEQSDRSTAIRQFKEGDKDVLVATDVAAKGLDFPEIKHVINFSMPSEIENYVHRIGRTGRSGKRGIATTLVDGSTDPTVLLDLKHLLVEAKQRVPDFLQSQEEATAGAGAGAAGGRGAPGAPGAGADGSCAFCGGLGHSITACPRLQGNLRSQQASRRDVVGGAAYGGNW